MLHVLLAGEYTQRTLSERERLSLGVDSKLDHQGLSCGSFGRRPSETSQRGLDPVEALLAGAGPCSHRRLLGRLTDANQIRALDCLGKEIASLRIEHEIVHNRESLAIFFRNSD